MKLKAVMWIEVPDDTKASVVLDACAIMRSFSEASGVKVRLGKLRYADAKPILFRMGK